MPSPLRPWTFALCLIASSLAGCAGDGGAPAPAPAGPAPSDAPPAGDAPAAADRFEGEVEGR